MAKVSPGDAALEGFKVMRERPLAVAVWGALYLALVGVFVAIFVVVLGPGAFGLAPGTERTPEDEVLALAPAMAVGIPVGLLVAIVLTAAMYRAVIEPEESRSFYLRLGRDELRIGLCFVFLMLALVLVVGGGASLVGGVYAATSGGARWGLVTLAVLGSLAAGVFVFVKLSLLSPMAIAEKRVDVGAAWALTNGRFWPLLGAYALAFVLSMVVGFASGMLSLVFLAVFGGVGAMTQANSPDFGSFGPAMVVGFTLYMLVQLIGAMLQLVLTTVPAARAYRQLVPEASEAEVFA